MPSENIPHDRAYVEWSADTQYEIDRIVRAERLGKDRWRLFVKWVGFDDDHVTPEAMSKVLKQTNHPEILEQIEQCKAAYYAAHPAEKVEDEKETEPFRARPEPTRVMPSRERGVPRRMILNIAPTYPGDSQWMATRGLQGLRKAIAGRRCAVDPAPDDFHYYAMMIPEIC